MADIDVNWTDEPPESGKLYWWTFWSASRNAWCPPYQMRPFSSFPWDVDLQLRSVLPIPDPVPPPLPEGKA